MDKDLKAIRLLLEEKVKQYNQPDFIAPDPISIPHRFTRKEDIEIAGFLTAIIAWGNRTSIINNATRLIELMDNAPHAFITGHQPKDLTRFEGFVHRTFNTIDLLTFIAGLKMLYSDFGGLEGFFNTHQSVSSMQQAITKLKTTFFTVPHLNRTRKHLPDPSAGSAAKRMNMYLRWMIRKDDKGVDFGIWKHIPPAKLSCPLDVHSGEIARKLLLLNRKQNDAKAVHELDTLLRKFDPVDPVKYDFALFGMGMYESKISK